MTISVVVLNRDRQRELACCLLAMRQQSYRGFELIIVTNEPDLVRTNIPHADCATIVQFDDANVSAARNAGIAASNGDIIAFCDDDAVPEPKWLERICAPFADEEVGGAGGLIRGRNGVSIQWGPQEVDRFGNDWPLSDEIGPDRVLKTVGTNCAFRRQALIETGGFDEAYRYFLDETDLNWRLKKAGWKLTFAPEAEVHHSFAGSAYRTAERVPTTMYEIGASKAHFCNQHAPEAGREQEIQGFVRAQRVRLIKAMHHGLLEPHRVNPIFETLIAGLEAGTKRKTQFARLETQRAESVVSFTEGPPPTEVVLARGLLRRLEGRRSAKKLSDSGLSVTLLEYSYTGIMMRVWFHSGGFWIHRGGILGKISRQDPLLTGRSVKAWISQELLRLARQRSPTKQG